MSDLTPEKLRALAKTLESIARKRIIHEFQPDRRRAQRLPFRQSMRIAKPADARLGLRWQLVQSFDVNQLGLGLYSLERFLSTGEEVIVDCVPGNHPAILIPAQVIRTGSCFEGLLELGLTFRFDPAMLRGLVGDP